MDPTKPQSSEASHRSSDSENETPPSSPTEVSLTKNESGSPSSATARVPIVQPGMKWTPGGIHGPGLEWTMQPDTVILRSIVQRQLGLEEGQQCEVNFLAEGSFNKVFRVECGENGSYVMRVTLPVQPRLKTLSERATVDYLQMTTDIPMPVISAHESNFNNSLGFEWMLMNYVRGEPLYDAWHKVNFERKEQLVRQICSYLGQLFKIRFPNIGSLYRYQDLDQIRNASPMLASRHKNNAIPTQQEPDVAAKILDMTIGPSTLSDHHQATHCSASQQRFFLGDIVSIPFFLGDHLKQEVPRGTFSSSGEWLAACLQFAINENSIEFDNLVEFTDEDDRNAIRWIKYNTGRLLKLLPIIFPMNEEEFVLHHQDLSDANILVDGDGSLKGIVDWECVTTVPLWYACQIPKFLEGPDRDQAPNKDEYEKDDNGTYDEDYLFDLKDYEATQLRRMFIHEMERICPKWVEIYMDKQNEIKRDFDLAIETCEEDICANNLDEWLTDVEAGREPRRLAHIYNSPRFQAQEPGCETS